MNTLYLGFSDSGVLIGAARGLWRNHAFWGAEFDAGTVAVDVYAGPAGFPVELGTKADPRQTVVGIREYAACAYRSVRTFPMKTKSRRQ
ncbi:hypothetical protein [Natrinema halophilum]|uniref:Uncharacterized protein n=1 Tax=Natrinema halophilum TaxID=1699371 RepID=A0A7D5KSV8_9EURY|nr:hypothetical protein [Natrinema halophilum]QLG49824.1 hypothetical protein HYG82_13635 [Natrinema halophilum]